MAKKKIRKAQIARKTRETEVQVKLTLEGKGQGRIRTPIGFFNHLLASFAAHGFFDLELAAKGDVEIDQHHTVEDIGITLGQALSKALGARKGINRFGYTLIPMDEALTRVAIDISNRPYLVWKVEIPKPKLGEMDTELFKEWFQAFAQHAGVCLHIENLYADNSHHIVETCFKGLARALRQAVTPDERLDGAAASTKGSL